MKKLLTILAFALSITAIHAQERIPVEEKWKSEEISGSFYHGFVFHKNWEVDFTVESQDGRFTPSDLDIAKAEALIKKRIAYVNREHENQEGKCPIIDEHMLKYGRQHVGSTDHRGAHIVWVNFIWDDKLSRRLADDITLTTGGCGHFWHIKVNLDTEKVYGLEVNESGDVTVLPRLKKKPPRISRPGMGPKPQRIRKTGIMHNPAEVTF